ncbi:PREDICTED: protein DETOXIFICATION 44, chloroplastic isoform X2 [Nicotiana attenuata]|uniref:protein DETOXIFICATION 44, chloroplastic isoform X2 n=1 Tax=Nicotiana attenuata TaxID=49451 RepID=UPI0009056052|nr:PREDICTED: protein DETOXIFICATION 44, chloroplastic isoform X2 [Nicotiana attenuata]XP_019254692.1 PREDICTED: protein DETOXIFICATION 44, chloroplastic isoform X2 [Nicotiana attenuata]
MASALYHQNNPLFTRSLHHNNYNYNYFCYSTILPLKSNNTNCSARLRTTLIKSSRDKNRTVLSETSVDNSNSNCKSDSGESRVKSPDPDPGPDTDIQSSLLDSVTSLLKFDGIGWEIMSIALPAALALAADPITSLVDTAFVGHLGSVELAAVGISVSIFNLISKLFNVPLLNVTTSFVAEEQSLIAKGRPPGSQSKILLPSVSTSLLLALGLGIAETVGLSFGSGFLMNTMGISVDSPMRVPAEQFLTMRAFGAPPIVIALAAQGTFRGFKDTKTPLYAVGAGNLLNALLSPILIFPFGFGISGAATAAVISEYLTAFILMWKLNEKVLLIAPDIDVGRFAQYLKSGSLLIGRTLALLITTTLSTAMAAREGPIPMAGHQICVQVWLAVSLLTDALALAGQALLASGVSQGNYGQAREVVYKVLQIGALTGVTLGFSLFVGFEALSGLFSSDSEVLEIARYGTLFVAGSQPINAIAFVLDGLYYGVSDFEFAAYSMFLIGLVSSIFLLMAAPSFGLPGVWAGLFLFMTLRVIAGFLRLQTRDGPWKFLRSDMEEDGV